MIHEKCSHDMFLECANCFKLECSDCGDNFKASPPETISVGLAIWYCEDCQKLRPKPKVSKKSDKQPTNQVFNAGKPNQVLTKNSNSDGDLVWRDKPE